MAMNARLFLSLLCALCVATTGAMTQPVNIIFDTDMESDVDDVAALAMLHSLADNGEAEILATMVSSLNPWAVSTVDRLNTYFDRPEIPVGAVKTFGVYRNSRYAETISEGYLSNLSNLLKSHPDVNSSLTGTELIQQKVKRAVVMGGRYPYHQNYEKWGNFKPDPDAIRNVASNWPTPVIFTGGGDFARLFMTGKETFSLEPTSNPVSRAYQIFLEGRGETHHSADLIAVYVAVRGWEEFFQINRKGYNHIFPDGTLMWRLQPDDSRHSYVDNLKEGVDPKHVVQVFDDLMMQSVWDRSSDR